MDKFPAALLMVASAYFWSVVLLVQMAMSTPVEVRDEDRGIAIGKDGKNIFKAKKLAMRQHNIMDVQILQKPMDGQPVGAPQ